MDRLQSESICSRPRPCSVRVCPSLYLFFPSLPPCLSSFPSLLSPLSLLPSPLSSHLTFMFRVYQGKWSLATRDLERDIIPMCKVEGLGLAPWNVLGGGAFKTDEELSQIKQTGREEGRGEESRGGERERLMICEQVNQHASRWTLRHSTSHARSCRR